jgi:hypothetical protein
MHPMRLLHNLYIVALIVASAALIAISGPWETPLPTAIVCVGVLWLCSLSVINLRSTVVVMVFPVVLVLLVKYDAGSAALVAAIGSMSLQEYRIMHENNPRPLALLKFVGNRAITALSALAASAVFHLVSPGKDPTLSSIWFTLAATMAGATWVITSGLIVNIQIMLSRPQFRLRIEPSIVFGSVYSTLPSVVMGMMGAAMYELGGTLSFVLAQAFFIYNKHFSQRAMVQKENAEQINLALARIIDSKDHYTAGHSERVAQLARSLAEKCHMSRNDIERLEYVALLHDLGKVNIPDSILSKPSALTPTEYDSVKMHSQWGAELIRGMDKIYSERDYRAILEHHERYDGKGYPLGKRGQDISLWARVLCICDSWDAMTSERVYRRGLSKEEAIAELRRNAGTQFDPGLVEVFIRQVLE